MSGAQPAGTNSIDYRTISSTGSASDFGDLDEARVGTAAMSNDTNDRCVMIGGSGSATDAKRAYNQYVTITTTGNAAFFGNSYNCGRVMPNTFSNGTGERGVIAGGYYRGFVDRLIVPPLVIFTFLSIVCFYAGLM